MVLQIQSNGKGKGKAKGITQVKPDAGVDGEGVVGQVDGEREERLCMESLRMGEVCREARGD